MTDEPTVRTDRTGHTLVITLNRPGARNAVDADVATHVADALDAEIAAIGQSADAMEGIVAFIARRSPSRTAS